MSDVMKQLEQVGVIPVVVLEREEDALPLAQALTDGGLPCAEITFRTDAAEGAIREITKAFPQMLTGAGTVLSVEQASRAIDAGAKFIVAPGTNPEVVSYVTGRGIPMVSGAITPTEIEQAMQLGVPVIKFFPAQQAGGTKMLQTLRSVYGAVRFIPTGGIDASNVADYLALDCVFACGGSWMVKKELIASGEFETIRNLTAEAMAIVKKVRG